MPAEIECTVRKASMNDSGIIAAIHHEAFARQQNSEQWVSATLAASPRFFCYVVEVGAETAGYIFWAQKSGIRPEVVLALDQVAVLKKYRGMGYAEKLIRESIMQVERLTAESGQKIKSSLGLNQGGQSSPAPLRQDTGRKNRGSNR